MFALLSRLNQEPDTIVEFFYLKITLNPICEHVCTLRAPGKEAV